MNMEGEMPPRQDTGCAGWWRYGSSIHHSPAHSSNYDDAPATLVIDNGSWKTMTGFTGSVYPVLYSHPSLVILVTKVSWIAQQRNNIGYEAQNKRDIISLKWPIEHGIIINWDDMEK